MANMSFWREKSRPIIAQVIKEHKDKPDQELKKALFEAYPFGARKYHPYKVWLDEVSKQLGKKKRYFGKRKKKTRKQAALEPKQLKLI
jgi:hypothetical protein